IGLASLAEGSGFRRPMDLTAEKCNWRQADLHNEVRPNDRMLAARRSRYVPLSDFSCDPHHPITQLPSRRDRSIGNTCRAGKMLDSITAGESRLPPYGRCFRGRLSTSKRAAG